MTDTTLEITETLEQRVARTIEEEHEKIRTEYYEED